MRQVVMGRTGLLVSELGLGTANFGSEVPDEAAAFELLDAFAAAGGTLVDTASSYGGGRSEELIGAWLATRDAAADVVVSTKLGGRAGDGPNDTGLSRQHIVAQVDTALRRLRRDHVDILFAHVWDPLTPAEETLSAMDDVVRAGKVRYLGASNFAGWQLTHRVLTSQLHGWQPFACTQPEYSLVSRQVEWEVLPAADQLGLGVFCWAPLGGGWLTGRHTRTGPAAGTRIADTVQDWQPDSWQHRDTDLTWQTVDEVRRIAEARDVSPVQVALNWLRAQQLVTAPIVGARTVEQLTDSLGCADWDLNDSELDALDAASRPTAPYPYHFIAHYDTERRADLRDRAGGSR